jgi:hypothetical protein
LGLVSRHAFQAFGPSQSFSRWMGSATGDAPPEQIFHNKTINKLRLPSASMPYTAIRTGAQQHQNHARLPNSSTNLPYPTS